MPQIPEKNLERSGKEEYRMMFILLLSSLEKVFKDIVSLRLGMEKICEESLVWYFSMRKKFSPDGRWNGKIFLEHQGRESEGRGKIVMRRIKRLQ